ncbi:MAG: hypothetical protein A3F67_06750 [Verrucomicrobia bacterium RIFCSPHIGHO2_12_FULL_41_10]|nr:MAG: hypothetical protein A3F67_06750 [Verrucomicrobia bacterium RIFCSPHIGHO2_12_FULL_41_10]
MQGADGAQKLSVQKLLDASSTGATKQFAAEVEFGKKSNKEFQHMQTNFTNWVGRIFTKLQCKNLKSLSCTGLIHRNA